MAKPTWWPPVVGDKIRKLIGGEQILHHVVSVFHHADETYVVLAWFGKHKQWWHFIVVDELSARMGAIWRDGDRRPVNS